jgi:hypothetical protein
MLKNGLICKNTKGYDQFQGLHKEARFCLTVKIVIVKFQGKVLVCPPVILKKSLKEESWDQMKIKKIKKIIYIF